MKLAKLGLMASGITILVLACPMSVVAWAGIDTMRDYSGVYIVIGMVVLGIFAIIGSAAIQKIHPEKAAMLKQEKARAANKPTSVLTQTPWQVAAEPISSENKQEDSKPIMSAPNETSQPVIAQPIQSETKLENPALTAMQGMEEPDNIQSLINALQIEDKRSFALNTLRKIGSLAIEPLIASFKDTDRKGRENIGKAFVQIGTASVEPLLAALNDANKDVRAGAAWSLGQLHEKRAVEPLLAVMQDTEANVRESATLAFGALRDARSVEPLLTALQDAEGNVRWAAAWALGQLGDARAVEPLLPLLKDGYPDARSSAAQALGKLGDKRAVEPLLAALQDEYKWLRVDAIGALGLLGDKRAVAPLEIFLKDGDEWVRRCAAVALGRLGDVRPLLAALKNTDWIKRLDAVFDLGQLDRPDLLLRISDENDFVREAVARELKRLAVTGPRVGMNIKTVIELIGQPLSVESGAQKLAGFGAVLGNGSSISNKEFCVFSGYNIVVENGVVTAVYPTK